MFEISGGAANSVDSMKKEHKKTPTNPNKPSPLESWCCTPGLHDLNLPEKHSFSVPDSPARCILLDYTFWYSGKVIIQLWTLSEIWVKKYISPCQQRLTDQ